MVTRPNVKGSSALPGVGDTQDVGAQSVVDIRGEIVAPYQLSVIVPTDQPPAGDTGVSDATTHKC